MTEPATLILPASLQARLYRDIEVSSSSTLADLAEAIAAALARNNTLTTLYLGHNSIGAAGAGAIAAAVCRSAVLQDLQFESQLLTPDDKRAVEDRLAVNVMARDLAPWASHAVARASLLSLASPNKLPPAILAEIAVLAFGDDAVPKDRDLAPAGRAYAAERLLAAVKLLF